MFYAQGRLSIIRSRSAVLRGGATRRHSRGRPRLRPLRPPRRKPHTLSSPYQSRTGGEFPSDWRCDPQNGAGRNRVPSRGAPFPVSCALPARPGCAGRRRCGRLAAAHEKIGKQQLSARLQNFGKAMQRLPRVGQEREPRIRTGWRRRRRRERADSAHRPAQRERARSGNIPCPALCRSDRFPAQAPGWPRFRSRRRAPWNRAQERTAQGP